MSLTIFLAVVTAALLHATWNALVKGGRDKALNMTAVVLGHAPFGLACIVLSPVPAPVSWPYLAAGIALHFGYQVFLLLSYRVGDLTQVYPIARGTAPLLVALVSVFFLGVELKPVELTAVVIIGAGIMCLSLVRRHDGLRNSNAAGLAFTTGCFIAGYSLVDGIGARLAGTALGFYGWLTIANALLFAMFIGVKDRSILTALPFKAKRVFVLGGGASFAAYALVIWAFTHAPIALVTALRETSIILALFIGVIFLKERLDLVKVLSVVITLIGVILLRFSRA